MMGNEAAALVSAALAARKNAYVPYSGYPVGAAVLGEDGNVFTGCNVENVSYPAGMCAERNAIGSAVTAGCTSFQGIAVAGGAIRVLRCPAESAARS
jgi:cytidine deaminase